MRKIKNSKKTNANKDNTCTMEPFLGTSMYYNCDRELTEVEIACDTTDDTAIATNTTPTTKLCSYSERPVHYEDAAAATTAAGCGDHGSFDPATQLTRDHATGECRLKFFRLTSTCIGVPAKSGFGVMVEVPPRTGTGPGPGPHHHEHNEDNHHKNNSGMLLRFSHNAGATYYSDKHPRFTVPLDTSSPRRKLDNDCNDGCVIPKNKFLGESTTSCSGVDKDPYGATNFQTCYQHMTDFKYCWSNSSREYCTDSTDSIQYKEYECRPSGFTGNEKGWRYVDPQYVWPSTDPFSCGEPCQTMCRRE